MTKSRGLLGPELGRGWRGARTTLCGRGAEPAAAEPACPAARPLGDRLGSATRGGRCREKFCGRFGALKENNF